MKINGFELNYSAEEFADMANNKMRKIELIGKNFEGYNNLSEGDKKALEHLVEAAKILNDVALEQDHPMNLVMKQALENASATSEHAKYALKIFNSLNGVAGSNGIDKEPIEIFKGIKSYKGCNFYPTDMEVSEFHEIINKMLDEGKTDELKKILSARTMVRREGDELKAIDYTEYFTDEFSEIANELECAAYYTTDDLFKDYLGWQAQALLQNNVEMDILADKHWAKMQDTPLEFTLSRENYDDKMTPTIFSNKELSARLKEAGINPTPKDMLGIRVGIVNKEGTELLLRFKEKMSTLADLMPRADEYEQNVGGAKGLKQTMVDADIAALTGDYALCRGGITLAQNLPNNDKPSLAHGGGRRNVYHRQVRYGKEAENTQKILERFVPNELHKYYNNEYDHLFTIGHENGHSLGPGSTYQTALGIYQHIIEEHKADMVSAAMMPEYAKDGIISEDDLKSIYLTWIVKRHFMRAYPADKEAHRMADLIEYNYLQDHKAFWFDDETKLHVDFEKMQTVSRQMLADIIDVQLSKSPEKAKEYIDKWTSWGEINQYIADFKIKLGVKPYIEIVTEF
ncbi:MAG: hypothetical protein IKO06_04960 [Alphaproteobacteria bacterium]|nr:hypothetical protein [Alphaproteobacteria bacterium]